MISKYLIRDIFTRTFQQQTPIIQRQLVTYNSFNFSESGSGQEFKSSFKQRAAGKVQLKEFFKFTHPDFFQAAPKEVKNANSESIQNLNAYLQSVQSLNQ